MTVKNFVLDKFGNPIPDVNVLETGTTNGAITNSKGLFSIDLINKIPSLELTHVNYESYHYNKYLNLGGIIVPNPLPIIMQEKDNTLDTVVINSGTQTTTGNTKPTSKNNKTYLAITLALIGLYITKKII